MVMSVKCKMLLFVASTEIIATVVDLLQVTRVVLIRRYILWLVGKYGGNIPLMGIQVVSFVVYFTALSLKQTVYRRMVGGW